MADYFVDFREDLKSKILDPNQIYFSTSVSKSWLPFFSGLSFLEIFSSRVACLELAFRVGGSRLMVSKWLSSQVGCLELAFRVDFSRPLVSKWFLEKDRQD